MTVAKQAAPDVTPPPKPNLPGGEHRAIQNADGTWNVENVPIFAEHTVEIPGTDEKGKPEVQKFKVGREWLESALKKAVARFLDDGYMAPLHIHHHIFGKDTQPAGFFKLKRVAKAKYEGKQMWTAFADLVNVPPDIFSLIRRGMLPYRSVEIHNIEKPEIDSLALLDDEVPFFRFKLLTIGKEIANEGETEVGPVTRSAYQAHALRAYQSIGHGARVLMYMGGYEMPGTKKVIRQDDEPEEKKETENGGEKMADNGEVMKKAAEAFQAIANIAGEAATGIAEAMGGGAEEEGEPQPPAAVEMQDDACDNDKAVRRTAEETVANYVAPKNGNKEVTLQARVDKLENDKALDRKVNIVARDLITYGLDLDATAKKLHKIGTEKGLDAIDLYADTVKEMAEADPPSGFNGELPTSANAPKSAQAFAAYGEGAVEKAITFASEYAEMKSRGLSFQYDETTFIADQLRADGFPIPEDFGKKEA